MQEQCKNSCNKRALPAGGVLRECAVKKDDVHFCRPHAATPTGEESDRCVFVEYGVPQDGNSMNCIEDGTFVREPDDEAVNEATLSVMASYGGGGCGKGKGSGGKGGGGGGRSNPGKGEYYKNLSRGGGRGKGGGKGGGDDSDAGGSADGGCRGGGAYEDATKKRRRCSTADELCRTLTSIDGKPYPAYHDIEKTDYDMGGRFTLCIDHVQSDPFAPPSQCHVRVPLVLAGFPPSTLTPKVREVALRDWLARRFASAARRAGVDQRTVGEGGWHGRKGGELLVDLPGQHILERSCVVIDRLEGCIEARFTVALPARGRSICGDWAANVLSTTLSELVNEALYYSSSDPAALKAHLDCAEDQQAARAQLAPRGLVAFVADGAILARRSGASDLPLDTSSAVPFASPPSLRVSLPVPNAKQLVGMGVRRGVTLIVGGGFHGKSTLLEALQLGVYDKVPGDGREGVVTDGAAVKVHACMQRAVGAVLTDALELPLMWPLIAALIRFVLRTGAR